MRTHNSDTGEERHGSPAPEAAPDDEVGVTDLRARDYISILKRAAREAVDDQIPDSAAAMAYYAFLAIPALLLVSVGVFSLVASPSAIETIIDKLGSVIPAEAATLLEDALNRTAEGGGGLTMIVVGGVVAVWTASGVANALMRALNRVYDTDESRGFLRQRLVGLVMVAVGVAAFVLVFGLLVLLGRSSPAGSGASSAPKAPSAGRGCSASGRSCWSACSWRSARCSTSARTSSIRGGAS